MQRCDNLEYDQFLTHHLLTNTPVIFKTDISNWCTNWIKEDSVDFDYLINQYGHIEHRVNDCKTNETELMKLSKFFEILKLNSGDSYLKDFHLALKIPEKLYEPVELCRDDWMNEQPGEDDFKFLYFGGNQSVTLLHKDVYGSYSISTNVFGIKRWTLFPPSCLEELEKLIKVGEREGHGVDTRNWTEQERNYWKDKGMLECIQNQGETIFIPSNWYHQVENLTQPTISINHNWCNSTNIQSMYTSLIKEVQLVRESIDDVKILLQTRRMDTTVEWQVEFEIVVSDLLKLNSGWSFLIFWKMILHALSSSMSEFTKFRPRTSYIHSQVQPIYEKFLAREEKEWQWKKGLNSVLDEIGMILKVDITE